MRPQSIYGDKARAVPRGSQIVQMGASELFINFMQTDRKVKKVDFCSPWIILARQVS
jgi:hypothetical protein